MARQESFAGGEKANDDNRYRRLADMEMTHEQMVMRYTDLLGCISFALVAVILLSAAIYEWMNRT